MTTFKLVTVFFIFLTPSKSEMDCYAPSATLRALLRTSLLSYTSYTAL